MQSRLANCGVEEKCASAAREMAGVQSRALHSRSGRDFPLHDSELLECFDRATSFFDGFLDQFFAAGLFERPRENFGFGFRRNQQDPVNVTEKNISRTDAHRSNFNRNAEINYL